MDFADPLVSGALLLQGDRLPAAGLAADEHVALGELTLTC
jgi:hypothetical protein